MHNYQVLLPVPEREWRESSLSQPKDTLGRQNKTCFCVTARLDDGHIRWRGWFDSREDTDAFLLALVQNAVHGTPVPVEVWRLPSPGWHPDVGPWVHYTATTVNILTSSPGSLQTYNKPSDFSGINTIDTLAGGGSGGAMTAASTRRATGGGGGEWRRLTNWIPKAAASYQIGGGGSASGAFNVGNVPISSLGTTGGATWFDGASLGAASIGSNPGGGGNIGTGIIAGGAGGTGGPGGTGFAGGNGGTASGGFSSTGGGGAAGQNGAGANGSDKSGTGPSNGGNGDAGSGGAGGAGAGGANGSPGGNGAEYGSVGSGGGGGSCTGSFVAGSGGFYGGAGGGAVVPFQNNNFHLICSSGAGQQGMVVVTYNTLQKSALLGLL